MDKQGSIFNKFSIRLMDAIVGSIGFFLMAYQKPIIGTALIGIGS